MLRPRLGKNTRLTRLVSRIYKELLPKTKSKQSNLKIGKKTHKKNFTEEDTVMAIEHMKRHSMSLVIGKRQLKPHTILHPLEWITTLNVGTDMEQLELKHIDSRSVKWHNHFGKQLGSFF